MGSRPRRDGAPGSQSSPSSPRVMLRIPPRRLAIVSASTREPGFPALVQAHVDAWRQKWEAADVRIVGDEQAQRALRFASYHLIAAVNPADEHVSIGARGLTGEAYGDMCSGTPRSTCCRSMSSLILRQHGLSSCTATTLSMRRGARPRHTAMKVPSMRGNRPTPVMRRRPRTVVTPDGRVVTILTGEWEHHISADIAYAVWQYWRVTGDDAFMLAAGAEILVETARFWASRAQVERRRSCPHPAGDRS